MIERIIASSILLALIIVLRLILGGHVLVASADRDHLTGSGRSIIERIKLIAKKPKTAAYMLVAVPLIAAVAAGCTFTGAKGTEGPWNWSQELSTEHVTGVVPWTAVPGSGESDFPKLSDEETDTLVRLLNALKRGDFTENSELTGGTPTYGLRIQTSAGTYHLNESIAPAGALEMRYNDTQWWIDSVELTEFVIQRIFDIGTDIGISVESGCRHSDSRHRLRDGLYGNTTLLYLRTYTLNDVSIELEPGFTIREDGYRCFINGDGVMVGVELVDRDSERLVDFAPGYDEDFDPGSLPTDGYGNHYRDYVFEGEYHYMVYREFGQGVVIVDLMCPEYEGYAESLNKSYKSKFPAWAASAAPAG